MRRDHHPIAPDACPQAEVDLGVLVEPGGGEPAERLERGAGDEDGAAARRDIPDAVLGGPEMVRVVVASSRSRSATSGTPSAIATPARSISPDGPIPIAPAIATRSLAAAVSSSASQSGLAPWTGSETSRIHSASVVAAPRSTSCAREAPGGPSTTLASVPAAVQTSTARGPAAASRNSSAPAASTSEAHVATAFGSSPRVTGSTAATRPRAGETSRR